MKDLPLQERYYALSAGERNYRRISDISTVEYVFAGTMSQTIFYWKPLKLIQNKKRDKLPKWCTPSGEKGPLGVMMERR